MVDWDSALVVAGAALVSAFTVLAVLMAAIRVMDMLARRSAAPKPAAAEAKPVETTAAKGA